MTEPTTLTVELDVHTRSVRLAAVRAEELLEERTLPLRRGAGGPRDQLETGEQGAVLNSLHRRGHPPQC